MAKLEQVLAPSELALTQLKQGDPEQPIACLNLFEWRDQATYPAGSAEAAQPISGEQALQRYTDAAANLARERGGDLLFNSAVAQVLIGPDQAHWDRIALLYFPRRELFVQMTATDEYQNITVHRNAALKNWRVFVLDGADFPGALQ